MTSPPHGTRLEGRRSSAVWAGVAGAGTFAVVLAYFLYAYLYLAVSNDPWPPEPLGDPPLLGPAILLAVLVASAAVAVRTGRPLPDRPGQLPLALALAGVALTGIAVIGIGAAIVDGMDLVPSERAYDAIFTTVHVLVATATAAGVVILGLTAFEAHRLGDHPWVAAAVVVASVWWCAVVLGWLAVGVTLYLWPQLA